MGNEGDLPTGFVHIHDAICRDITRSMFLVQGVLPGEDPLLTTMWVMAGEPSHNVAVPLWAHSGRVPVPLDGDSTSAICDRVLDMRQITYDTDLDDDVLDLWALADPRGGGLYGLLHPLETSLIQLVADSLLVWRDSLPSSETMATFEDTMANMVLHALESWSPPKTPEKLVASVLPHSLHLQWQPVTEDRFGRPITVQGYRIYSQDRAFVGREIGVLTGMPLTNYWNVSFPSPYQQRFYRVTAISADNLIPNGR
jgi:hypothetical protein